MREKGWLIALCVILGMVSLGAAPAPPDLRILQSDGRSIVLEFTPADPHTETVVHEGTTYHAVTIPGLAWTTEVGTPQVPVKGVLLGASGGDAHVEMLASDYQTLRGYNLYPSPALAIRDEAGARRAETEFSRNAAVYATDAFYPGRLAEIGFSGYMRDQPVLQLRIYPLQYNPVTDEARFYRRMRLRVTFDAPLRTQATGQARGAAYERLLQDVLLNYASLGREIDDGAPAGGNLAGQALSATASQSPTLKISVTEDGLYEVTRSDLQGAGLDPTSLDPRTIQITNRGAEIPIYAQGEDDGSFDADDTILFYGTAITDVFTVENVYWLTYGGENGLRMPERDGTPGSAAVPTEFYDVVHAEEDTSYCQNLPNGAGEDHYFWGNRFNAPESRDYSLTLNDISTTAPTATVRVRLRGYSAPTHHTRIYLNGVEIDDQSWSGQVIYDHEVMTVPHSSLIDGTNTISVEAVDVGLNQFYVNWIEIGYRDTYVAEGDVLAFRGPGAGAYRFEVSNFTAEPVEVFDITDPLSVTRIISGEVGLAGSTYLARFEDTCGADTRYLALTPAQRQRPARIVLDEPSDLRSTANGADLIIITHEDFYTSALTLAAHRESRGLRTETVKVTDVYDEFNHGIFNPRAIRDFLAYAYENWTENGTAPAPQYVLLFGDANMDYKDNLGTGNINYVPTHLIETEGLGETPSDNWFVCVSGDDIRPDMFLGRISVRTSDDADAVVDKIIDYELNPPAGDWNRSALFVADDDELIFETLSEELIALLPGGFYAHRVYLSQYSPPDAPKTDIIDTIDDGVVAVSYAGHGNVDTWAGGGTFQTSDVASLNNGGRLPFVTVANCLNGFFSHPHDAYAYSLAEEFLRVGDKGALAVWAPTGLGYPSGHRTLVSELYDAMFGGRDHVVGSATTAAKISTYTQFPIWGDLVETFVLFGDPASRLNLPPYPTVTGVAPDGGTVNGSITAVITGTNFAAGATVELVRGAAVITATDVAVLDTTEISCTLNLTGAQVGLWDARVTNADGLFDTLSDAFTVSWPANAPTVTGITPDSGMVNTLVSAAITGTNFVDGATVELLQGADIITGTDVALSSPTEIHCTLDLAGAPAGLRDVRVTNPDDLFGTLYDAFNVSWPANAPMVTAIAPDGGMVNTLVSAVITGTNFVAGATVELLQGADIITGTDVAVSSPTEIHCTLDLAGASAGLWDVRVTNPDDLFGTLPDAFNVSWHAVYLPTTLRGYH